MLESRYEKQTVRLLELHGFLTRKDGRVGWPDRLVLLGRRQHLWVEFKQERGRLTPAQRVVFPKLEARGEVIVYARFMPPTDVVRVVKEWASAYA